MASYNEEFNQYRIFLENVAKSVVPQDSEVPIKANHLRNRISCHSDAEGEVIYWILKFLDEKKCPTKLIAPIVRNVLVEIQDDPQYKDPKGCPDFRGLATTVLEGFCIRLLDNVELNKILDTATSHSAQQQPNDDLLTIPIRTAAASQNKRRKMEDRSICIDEFHKVYAMKDSQKRSFYGVFDGHGGDKAAQYAASQLPFSLSQYADTNDKQIDALCDAFKYTDEKFLSKSLTSGTTATCTLYCPEEGRLYISWVGDSKAMLAKQHGKIIQLVTPHRPDLGKEKIRIRYLGGSIHFIGGEYRVSGCLNVTRSIGDIRHKKFLISEPDCVAIDLDKTEEFLVLATDGLWDYAAEVDIAKTVYDCIKEDCENIDQIPNRLIQLAQDRHSSDNILVVVIFFKQPSQIAKNCDNLTIMESQFDNIKEVGYYNSRNLYPSDENSTSNSHAIDAKQMRWSPNDNLNNIINEEVKQTTTTTTTTTSTTNNGQFDDNLLYSGDNIDLNQKTTLSPSDDNNLHHASTLENNGEEQLLGASFDNKNQHEQLTTDEFDNEQQRILEKNQPHQQQLGDTDADYGPETCVDVTDDVVMMTENSADTNNLLEQSVLSHSKDTLPSSDNCNPFDNKNTLDMEDGNEFQMGSGGVDAQLHLDDANKSTPLLSPEVEDLPLSSEGGMQYTNEGFQQSPMDEEIPVGIDSHQGQVEFEEDFMPRNGHLSPVEMKHTEEEKLDVTQKAEEEQEEAESLSKLERFGNVEEEKVNKEESNAKTGEDLSHQETDLDEEEYIGKRSESPVVQKENLYEHIYNAESDEADFRLKDEEEILEKHVEPVFVEKEHLEAESAVLDMSHRDELQQSLHNLEVDILEEKPILTGNILDNLSPLSDADEQKLNEFVEEKQDREEFSEKEDKVEEVSEKMIAVGQNGKNIELEEDECIHLEEDVRPSDYLAMVERQKLELEQLEKEQSEKVDNQLAEEARQSLEHTQELLFGNYQEQGQIFGLSAKHEAHLFEDDDRLSDKVEQLAREKEFEKDERLNEREQFDDEKLGDGEEYKEHFIDEQFNDEEEEPFVSKKVDEKFELEEESYDEKFDQEEKEQLSVEKAGEKLDAEEDLYSEKFDKEEKEELPVEKIDEVEKEQLPAEDVVEEPIEKAAEKLEAVDEKIDEVEKELPPIESAPELLQELVNQLEKPAKELVEEICEQVEQVYSDNNELVEQVEELEREKQDKADEKLDKQIEQIEQNEHYDIDDSFTQATEQLEQQRHLDDIEIMGQQNDRFEKEDQAEQLDDQLGNEQKVTDLSEVSFPSQIQEQAEPSETLNEKQNEELESEQTQVQALEENILSKEIDSFPTDNKYQSEEQPLSEEISPVLDESIAQPEKQCFEEPEKTVEEIIPQQNVGELVLQTEEPITSDTLPISPQSVEEETENKLLEDGVEEIEKQLEEVNEKVLSKIENQILDLAAPLPKPRVSLDKPVQEYDEEPEELVEVEEPLIIKEQVPIKPSALSVTSQEPSAVPPTHESCDESEDDEWKYMKEGQGEKQLLGLQGDIVLEEEIQQQLQEESTQQQQPEAKLEQQPLEATTLTEEVITKAPDQIETIKDTFESLTQNIAELAENAAAPTESVVDKIGDTLENLNLSQSSTREKLDNIEDDEDILASEMNSKLNPEAKEFIPTFSPTAAVEFANGLVFGAPTATAIPHHFKDDLIAQSPRKGRESNMENINIPAENEFDEEIAHKPHGLPGDEIIIENAENGGLYQEMNWKEAMHGSEKEEGPLVDSPVTEESLEVVENVLQYGNAPNLCDFSAPVGLDNAGMKESIYIENNTSAQSNEEDVLNTVQVLPVDSESQENSLETENKEEIITPASENAPIIDVVTDNQVQEILTLAGDEKKEEQSEENIEKRMEELLLSHDREITKDVPIETEQVPINGVEMSPTKETPSTPDESSPAVAAIALGTAAAVAVAATTTAVKKAEAEKNQKNLNKTSSATKSKVPDTKKPTSGTASKVIGSSTTAKRSLGEKPKPSVASSVAIKKTTSTTTTAAPRPRTAPSTVAAKTIAEKKTTTTTTSTAKSRIDTKPPITLAARKPLTSTATKTSSSKPGDDAKSSNTTVKSSISGKPLVGSKTSVGSAKPLSAANSITKTRPATASAAATTNGSATKTAASKPTTLAPKSAGHTKPSLTSPRGTLTSSLRKTEAIKSPVKTTTSTAASRTSLSTNGTKTTTTTRTTTTTKTLLSTVPATAAKSTTGTTTTTRRTITSSGTSSTVGATTPTSKTPNNLVSRKSTPLKKTTSTPTARKSIGSKLNASATKPTKDTTTPRPVTIPPQHQNNNNSIVEQVPKVDIIPLVVPNDIAAAVPLDNGEPKLNGVATPDDLTSPTAPVAQSLVEIA